MMRLHLASNEILEGHIFKKKCYELWVRAEISTDEREAYSAVEHEISNMIIVEY